MAELYFDVHANYEEVIKLREECKRLEDQIIATAKATGSLDATVQLQAELTEATDKLNDLVDNAAKAGAELNENVVLGLKNASGSANQFASVLSGVKEGLSEYIEQQTKSGEMDEESAEKARKLVTILGALQNVMNVVSITQAANNAQTKAGSAATAGFAVAQTGATVATTGLTASVNALSLAMKANPIGLALSIIPLATSAISAFSASTDDTGREVKEFNKAVEKEVGELDDLYDILNSTSKGTKTHRDALYEVNEMCKEYNTTLLNENDTLEQQKKKYSELTLAIRAANAEKIGAKYIDKAQASAEKKDARALRNLRNQFNMSDVPHLEGIREDVWAQLALQAQTSVSGLSELSGAAYNSRLKVVVDEFKSALKNNSDASSKEIERMDVFITKYVKSLVANAKELDDTTANIQSSVEAFSPSRSDYIIENMNEATFEQLEAEWERLSDAIKEEQDSFEKVGDEVLKRKVESAMVDKAVSGTRGELKERKRRLEKEIDDLPETSEQIQKYQDIIEAIDAELKRRDGKDNRKSTNKNNEKEEQNRIKQEQRAIKYSELERKQAKEAERLAIDSVNAAEQARIDTMEEGTEKVLAQMDLDHAKELEQLKRNFEDLRDEKINNAKELYEADVNNYDDNGKLKSPFTYNYDDKAFDATEQEAKTYNAQVAASDARYTRERMKVLLGQYKDYATQRLEIEKKYNTDIALLEKERATASENDKEKYDRAIIQATKERNSELFQLDMQNNDELKKALGDVSKMTVEEVSKSIEILENYLANSKELSLDDIEAIENALKNLRGVAEDFSLDGLMKNFSKAIGRSGKSGLLAQVKVLKEAWANMKPEERFAAVAGWVGNISNGLKTAAGYMMQIAESSQNANLKESAEMLNSVASVGSSIAQGASQGGWIGAIAGGLMGALEQTISSIAQAKEETAEAARNAEDFANALQKAALTVNSTDFSSIFGTDSMGLANAYGKKSVEALNKYNEGLASLNRQYDEFAKRTRWLNGAAAWKGFEGIQNMRIKTKDRSGWANFWGKGDEYTSLGELAPELWNDGVLDTKALEAFLQTNTQITDEQRRQLQNLLDIHQAYEDNKKALEDYLSGMFGGLSSDLADATIEGFRNGADVGVNYLKDSMLGGVTDLEKQMVQGIYNSYLSQYQKKFMNVIENGGSEEDLLGIYAEMFTGMKDTSEKANKAISLFEQKAEEYGFAMDNLQADYEEEATTGSFKGMTQQMGAALEGRFTAVQISNEAIREQESIANAKLDVMMQSAMTQVRIAEEIQDAQALALIELQAINRNTKPLASMAQEISTIRSKVERL